MVISQILSILESHRNDLEAAEEKLVLLVKNPYSQHAWNFAHSAFALALIYQARGRTDEANQVGESVVSYALDTNNPVVLKVAQALQAVADVGFPLDVTQGFFIVSGEMNSLAEISLFCSRSLSRFRIWSSRFVRGSIRGWVLKDGDWAAE